MSGRDETITACQKHLACRDLLAGPSRFYLDRAATDDPLNLAPGNSFSARTHTNEKWKVLASVTDLTEYSGTHVF